MSKSKVSGKTHTKQQLDDWANQNNPNNKAYRANLNNHANQLNPNNRAYAAGRADQRHSNDKVQNVPVDVSAYEFRPRQKTHQQIHNARRRAKQYQIPVWAPDYPEYDD